jgi:transposase
MARRRTFSAEFKREAVGLVRSSGQSTSRVARDLGINSSVLTRWVRETQGEGSKAFPGHGRARDEELAALKRELVRVKKERDFLKEAAAFFAKESK